MSSSVTFKLLKQHLKEMREDPDLQEELAAEAIEDAEEGAPLLRHGDFE